MTLTLSLYNKLFTEFSGEVYCSWDFRNFLTPSVNLDSVQCQVSVMFTQEIKPACLFRR